MTCLCTLYRHLLARLTFTDQRAVRITMHPALIILCVVFGVQLVNLIGRERIEAAVRPVYVRLLYSQDLKRQKQLKKELFATRQQLNLTSSQDEFAKWAKLRRSVDKMVNQLEATSTLRREWRRPTGLSH